VSIHNHNNLEIIEYDLDRLFSNLPFTIDLGIQFAKIYRKPIVYGNIGIEIHKYDSFLEMISTSHPYEKRGIGEKILEYSYKYKLAQEFKIELVERCKILCWKYNMSPITPTKKKNETEKCKTILSSDVNAPSVRACFHLTAFYSG
jgi:hypothetical protein